MIKKSVAMATYNGEKYIEEQLASIYQQTCPVDEVRIFDDCSSDYTVEIVEAFIKNHHLEQSWSIVQNEKNVGYAKNFIKAIQATQNEFIFFCDQDDIWKLDRVEKMSAIMEKHAQILVLGSEFDCFSESENAKQVPQWELNSMKHDGSLEKIEFNAQNIFIGAQGCTMCIRKSFFNQAIPYCHEGWAYDEFVWKIALCINGLYMYHESTLDRRLHENNTSLNKMHTNKVRIQFLEDLYKSHESTIRFAKAYGNDSQIKQLEKNKKATNLRIELLEKRKVFNTIPLALFYSSCYHKKRAILRECLMALKNK